MSGLHCSLVLLWMGLPAACLSFKAYITWPQFTSSFKLSTVYRESRKDLLWGGGSFFSCSNKPPTVVTKEDEVDALVVLKSEI